MTEMWMNSRIYLMQLSINKSNGKWDSILSRMTRVWGGHPGFNSWQGQVIFLFSKMPTPALRPTQSSVWWLLVNLFPGVKRPGCEFKLWPASSVECKNEWSCPFVPPMYLHIMDRADFFFHLTKWNGEHTSYQVHGTCQWGMFVPWHSLPRRGHGIGWDSDMKRA